MTSPPLPREGATPSQVRLAAWHHAHQAHLMALEADRLAAEREADSGWLAAATAHAQVAQALLAAIATTDPGRVPHA